MVSRNYWFQGENTLANIDSLPETIITRFSDYDHYICTFIYQYQQNKNIKQKYWKHQTKVTNVKQILSTVSTKVLKCVK